MHLLQVSPFRFENNSIRYAEHIMGFIISQRFQEYDVCQFAMHVIRKVNIYGGAFQAGSPTQIVCF
jgi:hypothetical protein